MYNAKSPIANGVLWKQELIDNLLIILTFLLLLQCGVLSLCNVIQMLLHNLSTYYHCFAWLRWRLLLQVIQAYTYSGHQKKHQELSVRQCQSQISQWHRLPCQGRSEVTHSSDSTPQSTSTRPAWSRWMEIAGAIDMTENAKLLLYKSLFLPCQKDVFSSGNPTDRVSLA
jgi:hypothetical protein